MTPMSPSDFGPCRSLWFLLLPQSFSKVPVGLCPFHMLPGAWGLRLLPSLPRRPGDPMTRLMTLSGCSPSSIYSTSRYLLSWAWGWGGGWGQKSALGQVLSHPRAVFRACNSTMGKSLISQQQDNTLKKWLPWASLLPHAPHTWSVRWRL